jgi:Ca2+-binding EF-hand superfamily protein
MKTMIYLLAFAMFASVATAQEWSFFDALDKNDDGKVTESEWLARNKKTANKKGKPFDPVMMKALFQGRDTNGDGTLSREEVENAPAKDKKKKKKQN